MRKAFADRFGRHALQPQAAGRLFRVCELNDVMKNQIVSIYLILTTNKFDLIIT
jgi:hypothetical protein